MRQDFIWAMMEERRLANEARERGDHKEARQREFWAEWYAAQIDILTIKGEEKV